VSICLTSDNTRDTLVLDIICCDVMTTVVLPSSMVVVGLYQSMSGTTAMLLLPHTCRVRVLAEPLTHTLCALPPKPSPHSSPHQHSDHTQHAHGHAPPLGSMSVHGSFNALPHASQVSHTNLAASIHGSMGHLHGSHGAPGHGAHAIQPPGGASGTAGGPAVQPLPLVCGQPAITVCCLRRPQASQQLAPLQVVEVQVRESGCGCESNQILRMHRNLHHLPG
jgi:hypothetical protein